MNDLDILGKLLSTASAALWAGAVIAFKQSSEELSSAAQNLVKNLVALLLFGLTLPVFGVSFLPDVPRECWLRITASGLIGLALGDMLFFAALKRLGAGLNAIVDCLYSPLVFILSIFFLGEPVTLGVILGGPLVVGALLLSADPGKAAHIPKRRILEGLALGSLSMLSMAAGIVVIKPVLARHAAWWVIFWRTAAGSLGMVLWMALVRERPRMSFSSAWRKLLAGAVLGTYLATAAWLFGMKYTTVTSAAVLNQLSTFFILLMAAKFLAEPLTRRKALAAMVAFAGGSLVLTLSLPL